MRNLVGGDLRDLVGWAGTIGHTHVFHRPRSWDAEGQLGVSHCSVTLRDVRDRSHVRTYEQPCAVCYKPGPGDPPRERAVALVRTPHIPAVTPVGPLDLRVTPDALLAIRSHGGRWIVFDPARPLMLETADDQAAEQWRTLRTTWPTETLVNAIEIADHYGVIRNVVGKWKLEPEFPTIAATIGDRPGWYREQWPAIKAWVDARGTRRGGKPRNDDET